MPFQLQVAAANMQQTWTIFREEMLASATPSSSGGCSPIESPVIFTESGALSFQEHAKRLHAALDEALSQQYRPPAGAHMSPVRMAFTLAKATPTACSFKINVARQLQATPAITIESIGVLEPEADVASIMTVSTEGDWPIIRFTSEAHAPNWNDFTAYHRGSQPPTERNSPKLAVLSTDSSVSFSESEEKCSAASSLLSTMSSPPRSSRRQLTLTEVISHRVVTFLTDGSKEEEPTMTLFGNLAGLANSLSRRAFC